MYSKLNNYIESLDVTSISLERRETIASLVDFVQSRVEKNEAIRLNFICTHNSRRSHLSQIWAQVMAHYFNVPNVVCFSGGTEATALYPQVAETLKDVGFEVFELAQGNNPIYAIKYEENEIPVLGFSKKWDDLFNPTSQFAAVMTCSQADEACPIIHGSDKKISFTFDDPKAFDDSPLKKEKYEERSRQIATELCFAFSQIKI
jgi:arsenate reductase